MGDWLQKEIGSTVEDFRFRLGMWTLQYTYNSTATDSGTPPA